MKFFAAIFALIFFSMMLSPCQDFLCCNDSEGNSTTHLEGSHSSESEHSDTDNCSPFCACNCCHTNVITIERAPQEYFEIKTTLVSYHRPTIYRSVAYRLWKPPWA